jgi:formylglycine-generating enzyme required for sulfatase activity
MGGVPALKLVIGFLLLSPAVVFGQNDNLSGGTIRGKRALLVANSAYQDRRLPALRTPKANAEALASVLANAHIQPEVAYDLKQVEMIATIQRFVASIQPGDFVLIYFSGYGYQADELNYLLPTTFDPSDDSSLGLRAYSVRNLLGQLEQRRAGPRMLILDASRPCPDLPVGLANMPPASNTLVAFSAAPNVSAPDPPDGGVNSFTGALIKAIQEPGSTPVRILLGAQSEVDRESGGKQVPFVMQSPVESFFFTEPAPPPPPRTVSLSPELKPGQNRENSKDQLIYAWIPPGVFKMGCVPNDSFCLPDENPRHEVKITNGFWITRTEVTTEAYQRFTGQTGHREPRKTQTNPKLMGTDLPVTRVSWDDAEAYCEWAGGHLPTEAQWEHAARGGPEGLKYPWGNQFDPRSANSFRTDPKLKRPFTETVPVRRLGTGNGFDLFDMVGNAREWTSDFYDPAAYPPPTGVVADPTGPSIAKDRVVRGGSFYGSDKHLRISARDHLEGAKDDNQTGFRCVVASLATPN